MPSIRVSNTNKYASQVRTIYYYKILLPNPYKMSKLLSVLSSRRKLISFPIIEKKRQFASLEIEILKFPDAEQWSE